MSIEKTLAERESNYGEYIELAQISQRLKAVVRDTNNWETLSFDMQETLDMICHKMARILNGNPRHFDSWHDIIGYARLVEIYLERDNGRS